MHLLKTNTPSRRRHRSRFGRCCCCLGIIVVSLVFLVCPARTVEPSPIPQALATPGEYELKAIYLYNFLQFVEWPFADCPLPTGHADEIVVIGETSLVPVLKSLQAKLAEKNRELKLVFHDSYQEGMDLSRCCLLFIAGSEQKNLAKIFKDLQGKHVLTVGESDAFVDSGVMITLLSRENKIRWAINRRSVDDADLKMSAKLLEIAEQVIE